MSTDADIVAKVVAYAIDQLGEPYDPSGNGDSQNTWDCSKLTAKAWAVGSNNQIKLTAYTKTQFSECVKLSGVSPSTGSAGLQQGDLLFYFEGTYSNGKSYHHVNMYIGDNQVISSGGPPVEIYALWGGSDATHFTAAARPKGIGSISSPSADTGSGTTDDPEANSNQRVVKSVRSVGEDAIALSLVAGTPQTARFAALNAVNETVFLNADSFSEVINGADNGLLQLTGNIIIPGDQYEVKSLVSGGRNGFEITIESDSVQSEDQARAVSSMISRSFGYQFKSIDVVLFGNPLIQLGDIVKFNYSSGKVESGPDDYYLVTRINHDFNQGLSTTITIKPLIQTVSVV